jgi:hypothetical protein
MKLLPLIAAVDIHDVIRWFDRTAGVIAAAIILYVLIEVALAVPDIIKTIKMHWM